MLKLFLMIIFKMLPNCNTCGKPTIYNLCKTCRSLLKTRSIVIWVRCNKVALIFLDDTGEQSVYYSTYCRNCKGAIPTNIYELETAARESLYVQNPDIIYIFKIINDNLIITIKNIPEIFGIKKQ
jgi:hypothetical protein